jgi:hypothetical protein
LAEDAAAGMFAMDYLSPQSFEVWKAQLQRGHVLPTTAAEVGRRLVRIHSKIASAEHTTQNRSIYTTMPSKQR